MFDFLANKFSAVFSSLTGSATLTPQNIDASLSKVKEALLEADVPLSVVTRFLSDVSKDLVGQKVIKSLKPDEHFVKVVYDRLVALLGGKSVPVLEIPKGSIVLMLGLQGAGKTTTIAKLSAFYRKRAAKKGKKLNIVVGSVDFARPAAIDQLEILAKQGDLTFYRAQSSDAVLAAQEIVAYGKDRNADLIFVDTAGRLHVDDSLTIQVAQIKEKIKPQVTILVLDSMTGQESLNVAQSFNQKVGFDGVILTKNDSESRGGAAFAFNFVLHKPLYFLGTGEKADDLEPFVPERMASRILGMGDVATLIERAEEKIKKEEQEELASALMKGNFTLVDFAKQLDMMGRLGSLSTLSRLVPGARALTSTELEQGEKEMKRLRAIINSMTLKERLSPKILDSSRKKRVALGAGVTPKEVDLLLSRFEESKQFVKLLKSGRFGRFM